MLPRIKKAGSLCIHLYKEITGLNYFHFMIGIAANVAPISYKKVLRMKNCLSRLRLTKIKK